MECVFDYVNLLVEYIIMSIFIPRDSEFIGGGGGDCCTYIYIYIYILYAYTWVQFVRDAI